MIAKNRVLIISAEFKYFKTFAVCNFHPDIPVFQTDHIRYRQRIIVLNQKVYREKCYRCFRPLSNCYCQHIKPFQTNIHFVILMHPKEARRQKTGTGRLTHLALQNSEIIVDVNFTNNKRINEIIGAPNQFSAILYPGAKAQEISQNNVLPDASAQKTINIFLIDATWACARKMMNISSNLQDLPHILFNINEPSRFLFKKQPQKHCLSTIEATFYFLQICNQLKIEQTHHQEKTLMNVLNELVMFQINNQHRQYPIK